MTEIVEFSWMNEIDARIEFLKVLDDTLRTSVDNGTISNSAREEIFRNVYEQSKSVEAR